MRILHVVHVPFAIPYFIGDQFEYMQRVKSHELFVACSPGIELSDFAAKWNFKLLQVEIKRKISIFHDIKSIYKLVKYISLNEIDIVVGHSPKGALLAMISGVLLGVRKRIYIRHGLVFETKNGLTKLFLIFVERFISLLSTQIICVSNSIYNQSLAFKLNKETKMIIILNGTCNGIDTLNKYNPDNYSKKLILNNLNLGEQDFVIGYVGRLSKDKGIEMLLDAFLKFKSQLVSIKLLLVGPIDNRDPISDKAINIINTNKDIIHTGYVADSSIYYKAMNIFVLPSFREGFPTVVLEASSMQLPVITTKNTGCIDSIIENETGIFTNISVSDISSKIQYYYLNGQLREKHGLCGRKFVVEKFNQIKFWENLNSDVFEK
jgi:glycosyltransferase involved in cell wall biosynthesis